MNALHHLSQRRASTWLPQYSRPAARLAALVPCMIGLFLLAACGRSGTVPPTPATAPTAAATPEVAVAAAAAESPLSDTEIPVITLEAADPFPQVDTPAPDVTVSPAGDSMLSPLEVIQATTCAIESDLDLAGYPDLEEKLGCAVAVATFASIGINEFGEDTEPASFMLWFSSEDTIYVLLPDGTWTTYPDTWDESQPEYLCNPYGGEATSPPLPRRGFGKLWCENEELQALMGPVPREERLCQHAVLQPFQQGQILACFEDATVRYFQLRSDQTWSLDIQR